ncbi:MAG: phospho-sugar mutase [Schleiferiaceae bacterium]|nr:phospho-sugar mutase [Schleiferiaceae bacterium]
MNMDPQAKLNAEKWLSSQISEEDKASIRHWIAEDPAALNEAFYTDLEFGTGGLRGIMRLGSNGINKYTLGLATQGLANVINREVNGLKKVAIAYDSRNQSDSLALEVAQVLAANGIHVFLFPALRPTPQLSFSVRHYGCHAGIVLTASHNPKEYNGYKVYWKDGGQLVPPQDQAILNAVRAVNLDDILWTGGEDRILYFGEEADREYLDKVADLSMNASGNEDLSVVFTALHGTSITMVPPAMERFGFRKVHVLESQATPDGNFPTVASPNPEEPAALALAIEKAHEIQADMVIGCDPDTDRVGIAVRDDQGDLQLLNGNQAAAVLVDYVLYQHGEQGSMPKNPFVASTVVTSPLLERVAGYYHIPTYHTLTGFKWIADLIRRLEGQEKFLVGGEESYGYLVGDFVRDKDAVSSAVMLAEAAAWNKAKGSSFYEHLLELYVRHGVHHESLLSITKHGREGAKAIASIMDRFRSQTPRSLAGIDVEAVIDFKTGKTRYLADGRDEYIDLPSSNVIQLRLANGDRVTARPSGTEPKIKYYFCTLGPHLNPEQPAQHYRALRSELEARIAAYTEVITAL